MYVRNINVIIERVDVSKLPAISQILFLLDA